MMPFLLQAPCKDYVWGGERLRAFGKVSSADRIAESWELSCHPDGESIIASGECKGMTLPAFLREHPEALGENCRRFDRFPVLVKLIDAQDDLSVQVHPDDAYARAHGEDLGKTELWYVIDAAPGAEILYGVKRAMTQEELRESIEQQTILDKLRHVPVKAGDVYFIPAGTIHAIGRGCLIAEVQQNSNTTYRVYDYGRGRELHIAQALDVARLTPNRNRKTAQGAIPFTKNHVHDLGRCSYFSTQVFQIVERMALCHGEASRGWTFTHWLCLDGHGVLHHDEGDLVFQKGDSIFVPADAPCKEIEGDCTMLNTIVEPK
ncbi:MAG: class I mannose-6-phosphate isomerase [Oscillospiraceae bacterium]|nr:class I mannose-6-phosphate isomerase [Oscillospiraceae bacterium]